ncbi:hypothetical protein BCV69DRAFT_279831 [Microstroma glucosiphilum]|uniref:Uncharacterized protein n=1 Tax=Pseudomicrostroma glucosiphilum TaxID=1684307 RepID=A0A316UF38_9BASI|nr:hypothetical protein BCV69DRAFT_279831 [Pseudomicrostroma glucosiphilum]PWN23927.1 hypothetical protein BCV69DRAFT_279831 [Pseudomicrostroma glucosiphilum]
MSRTDEEITEGRFSAAAALHPIFHHSITMLKDIDSPETLEAILQMPPPPPRREGADRGFPWSVSRGKEGEERKVWVVLATAPEADASSRIMDTLYNKTVGFIKDGPDSDGTLLSSFLSTVQDTFAGTSQYATAREDDEGRDEASSSEKRRQERAQASQLHAKDYNFAVADFTHEADLMWHWWIWK